MPEVEALGYVFAAFFYKQHLRFFGERSAHLTYVFTGFAFPCNDIGGVASLFQLLSSGGDRGSRMVFAGERGGGRNATAAK